MNYYYLVVKKPTRKRIKKTSLADRRHGPLRSWLLSSRRRGGLHGYLLALPLRPLLRDRSRRWALTFELADLRRV